MLRIINKLNRRHNLIYILYRKYIFSVESSWSLLYSRLADFSLSILFKTTLIEVNPSVYFPGSLHLRWFSLEKRKGIQSRQLRHHRHHCRRSLPLCVCVLSVYNRPTS